MSYITYYNNQYKKIAVYVHRFSEFWIFSDDPEDNTIIEKIIETLPVSNIYFNICSKE